MRPPPPLPRHFARAAPGLLLLVSSFLPAVAMTLHADDTVRRAQEELRNRNLYFGDIDGLPNRGTTGALKRYQERKRLAVTGILDGETLRSLGIPTTLADDGDPVAQADPPLPDVPVLRSDLARRLPPLADRTTLVNEEVAAAPGERDPGEQPSLATERDTPPEAGVNAAATPPPRSPVDPTPSVTDPGILTAESARAYLENYLRDGTASDPRAEMAYYAEEVDYLNEGPANREYIQRDVGYFYKRWPERHYEIIGPVIVSPGPAPGETTVRFQLRFRYRGKAGNRVAGCTDNHYLLRGTREGEVRIVAMKEARVVNH